MRTKLDIRKLRKGRLVRGVALFFLLFTLADITLPQYFCTEEFGFRELTIRVSAAEKETLLKTIPVKSDTQQEDQQPEQEHHEEDCFCCCTHILPTIAISIVPIALTQHLYASTHFSVPSPSVSGLFRPPRLS
jgi:hypothetical protein